ncbi:MAG TPA: alpha/beta hydrolase [Candidatus Baltobacteraceae bacterium]
MNARTFDHAYTLYGDARNPPLLFIHGIRLGREIWRAHALALAGEYRVATLDLPGHGALAELSFELPLVEALLAHVIDDVLGRPPIVIGYSLGGYVAMQLAHDSPERTAGLVLADCTLDLSGWLRHPYDWTMRATSGIPTGALQRALSLLFRLTLPREIARTIIPLPFNRSVFADVSRAGRGVSFSDRLRGYDKPALIVNGEWDMLFRTDERTFARAANARVAVIRHSDHVAPLRKPDEFTQLVRAFAAEVYRGGHGIIARWTRYR